MLISRRLVGPHVCESVVEMMIGFQLKAEEERLRVRREYINKLKAASLANEAKGIRTLG